MQQQRREGELTSLVTSKCTHQTMLPHVQLRRYAQEKALAEQMELAADVALPLVLYEVRLRLCWLRLFCRIQCCSCVL